MQDMGFMIRRVVVIPWSQTEIDGMDDAAIESIAIGAAWSWHGDVLFSDDVPMPLAGGTDTRPCIGATVLATLETGRPEAVVPLRAAVSEDQWFEVADGASNYLVTLLHRPALPPLVMFCGAVPPRRTELWIAAHSGPGGSRVGGRGDGPDLHSFRRFCASGRVARR
ncbi:hypothetical protein AB1M95_17090 [Sulfitobacter sp. LCG007]